MTSVGCETYQRDLGPFMDGELDGGRMLRVARHLEECAACTSLLHEMRAVGEALREGVSAEPPSDLLEGLAAGVVSRAAAEAAQSWRARLARGCEGWHWAIVGVGSVAATFLSTSLLSFILTFGPAPRHPDSLSSLATSLGSPAGFFFVYASPAGPYAGLDVMLLQVENGRPAAPRLIKELAGTPTYRTATQSELVLLLEELTTHDGRVLSIDDLGPEQRAAAQVLLDELTRPHGARRVGTSRSFNVHEMRLVTSAGVTAKRL